MVRKHAKPEIEKFLDIKRKTQIIIFDVETNGLNAECSVLSCSAIKYEIEPDTLEMTEIDRFNRYYYPVEPSDLQAITINGLSENVITKKREGCTYPEHFRTDSDFETFCSDTEKFIAHNISFDMKFIPFIQGKKKFCTMMTNTDIVCTYFLKWKNNWKWPKLSETAIHYGIQFSEKELHSSMADAELTAKIFMRMLKFIKADQNGELVKADTRNRNLDPFRDFIWQLRNVDINIISKCNVGDNLNLIRNNNRDSVYPLGVATKSGEYLGDIDSYDIKYYGLLFSVDHGANTLAKIKEIFTMDGDFESISIKVFIGSPDWKNKKELDAINEEAKKVITIANTLEKTNPEASVSLYKKTIEMLKGIDLQCEKHFSTWRKQKFPINRLSLVLERQRRHRECLDEIEAYERMNDKVGLYAGEKEIIRKRKTRMVKAVDKLSDKNDLYKVETKYGYTEDQMKLMVKHHYCKENEKFIKIQQEIETFESANKNKTDSDEGHL